MHRKNLLETGIAVENETNIKCHHFVFGSEELDLLLNDWLQDPQPKTITELARLTLNRQYERQTGFLQYDSRERYKKGDKIIIGKQKRLAEVIKVSEDAFHRDGYTCDQIDVRFLNQAVVLNDHEIKHFVAHDNEQIWANAKVKSAEIITEKDEDEIIPEMLIMLSKDRRFVSFEEKWLPTQILIDFSEKITDIEKVLAESKYPLLIHDILEKIQTHNNVEETDCRLEFSLNYFLSRDKRFNCIEDSGKKFYSHEPHREGVKKTSEKRDWTISISRECLEACELKIPRTLSTQIGETNIVHVLYDQSDEILPYDQNGRLIKGLANYYTKKAIAEGDKVHLFLKDIEPIRLFISCRWQLRIERLLQIEPRDLKWEKISLRDCIIIVLAKFETPAHYREIYTEIAVHKHVSLGSIISTLSRYCPIVFIHICWGKWGLEGWAEQKNMPKPEPEESPEITDISDEVWEAVTTIEEKDYVYKLIQKIRAPLSFNEICSRLADYMKVDVQELRATGFLKADDERLRRLDDGTWALEEWSARDKGQEQPVVNHDDEIGVEDTVPEDISKRSRFWLLVIILFILLFSSMAIGSIIIWLLIYGR